MRKRGNTDSNQKPIVNAFRNFGAAVTVTSGVGGGFVDIVVSYRGEWFMVEIKDGDKCKSAQKLTDEEVAWHSKQKAVVYIVATAQDVINLLTDSEGFRAVQDKKWQSLVLNLPEKHR